MMTFFSIFLILLTVWHVFDKLDRLEAEDDRLREELDYFKNRFDNENRVTCDDLVPPSKHNS